MSCIKCVQMISLVDLDILYDKVKLVSSCSFNGYYLLEIKCRGSLAVNHLICSYYHSRLKLIVARATHVYMAVPVIHYSIVIAAHVLMAGRVQTVTRSWTAVYWVEILPAWLIVTGHSMITTASKF